MNLYNSFLNSKTVAFPSINWIFSKVLKFETARPPNGNDEFTVGKYISVKVFIVSNLSIAPNFINVLAS